MSTRQVDQRAQQRRARWDALSFRQKQSACFWRIHGYRETGTSAGRHRALLAMSVVALAVSSIAAWQGFSIAFAITTSLQLLFGHADHRAAQRDAELPDLVDDDPGALLLPRVHR